MAKDIFRIPRFLVANTKEELVKKMLKNNIEKDKEFDYYLIVKEGSQWVAWYYINSQDMVKYAK